jgi:hypothetical protein
VDGTSVIAGGDVSEVFKLVEEAFDPVAQLVGDGVMRDENLAGAERSEGMMAAAPECAISSRKALLS